MLFRSLCRKEEIRWFYQEGASFIFPDVWQSYLEPIPENERGDLVKAFYKRLTSHDPDVRMHAAKFARDGASEYVPVRWLACQPGAAARGGPGTRRDAEKIDSRVRRCDVDGSSLGWQRERASELSTRRV